MVDAHEGSRLEQIEQPPPPRRVTMLTIVHGWPDDARRWLAGVQEHTRGLDFEALVVDNSDNPEVAAWLEDERDESTRSLKLQPAEGWARAVNRGLVAAAGKYVVLFDPGVELAGGVARPLIAALGDDSVAVAGAFGAKAQGHLGHFASDPGPDVDVLEGYVLAFRREDALAVGGFDRKFGFYRLADFEFCLRLRDRGRRRALVVPGLPVVKHEHRLWEALPDEERDRRSRRNYHRLLELWGKRQDLLVR